VGLYLSGVSLHHTVIVVLCPSSVAMLCLDHQVILSFEWVKAALEEVI